jgi:hypothetical protein
MAQNLGEAACMFAMVTDQGNASAATKAIAREKLKVGRCRLII